GRGRAPVVVRRVGGGIRVGVRVGGCLGAGGCVRRVGGRGRVGGVVRGSGARDSGRGVDRIALGEVGVLGALARGLRVALGLRVGCVRRLGLERVLVGGGLSRVAVRAVDRGLRAVLGVLERGVVHGTVIRVVTHGLGVAHDRVASAVGAGKRRIAVHSTNADRLLAAVGIRRLVR